MVLVTSSDYDHFKAAFSALGGTAAIPVLFSDTTASGGTFSAWAIFAGEQLLSTFNGPTKPPTFGTDFTQAIEVDSIGLGG